MLPAFSCVFPSTHVLLTVILLLLFLLSKAFQNRLIPLRCLPGPPMHFLLRELLSKKRSENLSAYLLQLHRKLSLRYEKSGIYKIWLLFYPLVVVFRPDVAEAILSSPISIHKSWEYGLLHCWLGTGLLTSTGEKWRFRRKRLSVSFHLRVLEKFNQIMNEETVVLIGKLKSFAVKEWVDICPLIQLCALDIISGSIMGVRINSQLDNDSQYVKAVHKVGYYFVKRNLQPWQWPNAIFSLTPTGKKFRKYLGILQSFTRSVIQKKKGFAFSDVSKGVMNRKSVDGKGVQSSTKEKKMLMDLLLELHFYEHLLTEEDVREEVDTFMFEGHDTTAMGISWALYCIGLYPRVQMLVYEELETIFGNDKNRPVNADDLKRMKYLEMTIKESQRLFPPVPLIGRTLAEDIKCGGVLIPKETTVHISIMSLHKNPKEFPNPEMFEPERFLPENSSKRHPYSFIPFSGGPRNCIGQRFAMMEEKIVISNILRHFEVISLDQREKVQVTFEMVLRPIGPLRMRFVPRISPGYPLLPGS